MKGDVSHSLPWVCAFQKIQVIDTLPDGLREELAGVVNDGLFAKVSGPCWQALKISAWPKLGLVMACIFVANSQTLFEGHM